MPAITHITKHEGFVIELALHIDDPAGIEQIQLATAILDTFTDRSDQECVIMRHSLLQWAKQFPHNPPPTQRSSSPA